MRAALLLVCLTAGCAHYEYNIVEPADLSRHIGAKDDAVVAIDPLEYRLRTVDSRLVMRIYNRTNDPVELLGEKSVIVDSHDQSHPLVSQAIAPQSFIKLILPPYRPRYGPYGPTFGIGVGARVERGYDPYFPYRPYEPYDFPRYFTVYGGAAEALYWDWEGDSDASMTLVYRRGGGKEFQHRFKFHRQKM
jgi:hypothetical protein